MALNERDRYIDHTLQTADKEDLSRSDFFHLLRDTSKEEGDSELQLHLEDTINSLQKLQLTRRDLLKMSVGAAAGTALGGLPEAFVEIRRLLTMWNRRHMPRFVDSIKPHSIATGTSPDRNLFENVQRYENLIGHPTQIVNIFLTEFYDPWIFDRIYESIDHGKLVLLSWRNPGPIEELYSQEGKEKLDFLFSALAEIDDFIIFSPLYEPQNSEWYQASPERYVDTWKNLYTFARDEKQMWCPFIFRVASTSLGRSFVDFCPDPAFTDGYSGDWYKYAVTSKNDLRHFVYPDLPAKYEMGIDIKLLQELYPGKTFILTEYNSSVDIGDVVFDKDARQTAAMAGARAIIPFNWKLAYLRSQGKFYEEDWDVCDRPHLIEVHRRDLIDPRYMHHSPKALSANQIRSMIFAQAA